MPDIREIFLQKKEFKKLKETKTIKTSLDRFEGLIKRNNANKRSGWLVSKQVMN